MQIRPRFPNRPAITGTQFKATLGRIGEVKYSILTAITSGLVGWLLTQHLIIALLIFATIGVFTEAVTRTLWKRHLDTLEKQRGITKICSGRSREHEYASVWKKAHKKLLCTGVAMTNVAQDRRLIERTVERGVQVTFVMVDPDWLERSPAVQKMMNDFYGQPEFHSRVRGSYEELTRMAAQLNSKHGEGRVRIIPTKALIFSSATIADQDTPEAWGYLEFHLFDELRERIRFEVHIYDAPDADVGQGPVLRPWLVAMDVLMSNCSS